MADNNIVPHLYILGIVGIIALVVSLLGAAVILGGVEPAPAEKADSGYFSDVARNRSAETDVPFKNQDFSTFFSPEIDSDNDQISAGNATVEIQNETTINKEIGSYLYVKTTSNPAKMKFTWTYDTSENMTDSTVTVDSVKLVDDEASVVNTFDPVTFMKEDSVTSSQVSEGTYYLNINFDVRGADTPKAENVTDKIGELDGDIIAPAGHELPSDKFDSFNSFVYRSITKMNPS